MKRILKTVAMFLIVVMLANSVTSCVFLPGLFGGSMGYGNYPEGGLRATAILFDGVLLAGLILAIISAKDKAENRKQNSSLSTQNNAYSAQIKQSSFMKTFNTLPKTQINLLAQKVETVPETELNYFLETYNTIPQTDIMLRLNTVSETELYNTVGYLNSLSEMQFNSLLMNITGSAE
jgi:hypothetical protein